jgi:hypothetical protein
VQETLKTWEALGRPTHTPYGLKPDVFSVHCPSYCRDSPKALPAPLDVSGRVLVAVQDEPAVGADMGADRETLLDPFPAATTVLGRIRRRDGFHSLPSAFCLESEDRTETVPPGVLNRFVEASLVAGPIV